ncbi:hypothetical protein CRE_17372 [Caenorhabditis remanei]|uniref:F-box associated domain-containing protein n=1 Tax=Caenorhabditis remanei TaxID=31234 RepID=E3N1Z3_CAERE|nr:hypothetical protein CRE_17372 [Caenorhabditis remanei]
MDNLNQPRRRPLGYDGLKSVLKSMSVEKRWSFRQEVHNHLPTLRSINSLLPYTIENAIIWEDELHINRTKWAFRKNPEQSNPNDDDPNQTTISFFDHDSLKRCQEFRVNKTLDEAFEKCFNVYFKNGSNIQELDLSGVPKFLCDRDGSADFKLNILSLSTLSTTVDSFDSFIRFVNLDRLDHISLVLDGSEHGEELRMLEKPAIINCKNLDLEAYARRSLINFCTGLRNRNLVLNHNKFDVNDLRMLIENWKTSDRPIGTCFCLLLCVDDMLHHLELQNTFPVEIQRDSIEIQGIGIKMDDNRDLVLYNGEHQVEEGAFAALKMEVIASGSAKKIGDSEVSAKEADEGEPNEKRARQ